MDTEDTENTEILSMELEPETYLGATGTSPLSTTSPVRVPSSSTDTPTTSVATRNKRALRYVGDIKTPDLETPRRRRECLNLIRHTSKTLLAEKML